MEVYVLNKNLIPIGVIDNYNSFIWTERYAEAGDFELSMPASKHAVELFQQDYYLKIKDSNELMIIETITIKTERGSQHMTVTGRSLSSILDRRIILGTRYFNMAEEQYSEFNKTIYQIVEILLNDNAIKPGDYQVIDDVTINDDSIINYSKYYRNKRKINELSIGSINNTKYNPYGKITDIGKTPLSLQFNGESLYDAIKSICDKRHLGFKIIYDPDCQNGKFVFYIYDGQNRTSTQNAKTDGSYNNSVVLSPIYENIGNISYVSNKNGYKNMIIAMGDESDNNDTNARLFAIRTVDGNTIDATHQDGPEGLDLRELVNDFSEEIKKDPDGADGEQHSLSDTEYKNVLAKRANEYLDDQNSALSAFDGEIINNSNKFKAKVDYDLGDIIEMTDNLGHVEKMRVTEIIYSHNSSGYKIYPTLAKYEKDEYIQPLG